MLSNMKGQEISFPLTQTVLWDHRPVGPSTWIHVTQYRNPAVIFEEKALRLAHHFSEQSENGSYNCYFTGCINVDSDGEGITINIDQFISNNNLSAQTITGGIILPCFLKKNNAKPQSSVEDYSAMIKEVLERCHSKSRVELAQLFALRVFASYHDNRTSFMFHMDTDCVLPITRLRATPVASVPILATALTRNLCTPMNISSLQSQPKTGYLTMDNARHLLLVLESDPKAPTLPLIGIWIAGISTVHHPFVWAAGIRYLMNSALLERVCQPPEPFLLVLYSPTRSTPEFFECVASNGASHNPVCLMTHHDVFQLSKENTGRMTTPVEMELMLVESGPRRDLLDAAMGQCQQFLERRRPSLDEDGSHGTGSDDIIPRSIPSPLKSQAPLCVVPSVPDVTLIFDQREPAIVSSATNSLVNSNNKPGVYSSKHRVNSSTGEKSTYQPVSTTPFNGHIAQRPVLNGEKLYNFPVSIEQTKGHAGHARNNQMHQVPPYGMQVGTPSVVLQQTNTASTYYPINNGVRCGVPENRAVTTGRIQPDDIATGHFASQSNNHLLGQSSNYFHGHSINHLPVMIQPVESQSQFSRQPIFMSDYVPYETNRMVLQQNDGLRYGPPLTYQDSHIAGRTQATLVQIFPKQQPCQPNGGIKQLPTSAQNVNQNQFSQRYFAEQKVVHRQMLPQNCIPLQSNVQSRLVQNNGGKIQLKPGNYHADNYNQNDDTAAQNVKKITSAQILDEKPVTHSANQVNLQNSQSPVGSTSSPLLASDGFESSHNNVLPIGQADGASPEVVKLLRQQEEQLRLLREQVAMLLSKQAESSTDAIGKSRHDAHASETEEKRPIQEQTAKISVSVGEDESESRQRETALRLNCSKAVNTSAWLNSPALRQNNKHGRHRQHREKSNTEKVGRCSRMHYKQIHKELNKSSSSSYETYTEEGTTIDNTSGEIADGEDEGRSEALSLRESEVDVKADEANDTTIMSEIIVDMPALSLSPEKSGNRSSSGYGGTEDSNRSPALGDSISMLLGQEQDADNFKSRSVDTGKATNNQNDSELLFTDQKRYYRNMLTGLQKMLTQQQQSSGVVSEAEVNRLRQLASNAEEHLRSVNAEIFTDSMNVVRKTKEQLANMLGDLNTSVLETSSNDTLRCEQSLLLEPVYLPKVNYMSMYYDHNSDMSMEADTISLKYLSDEQLTAEARTLQRLPHPVSLGKDTAMKKPDLAEKTIYAGPSMSFASRRYLERYGLTNQSSVTRDSVPLVTDIGNETREQAVIDQLDESSNSNLGNVWKMLMKQKQNSSFDKQKAFNETLSESAAIGDGYHWSNEHSMNASSLNMSGVKGDQMAKPFFYHSDGDSFHVLAKNTSTPAGRPMANQRQLDITPPRLTSAPTTAASSAKQELNYLNDSSSNGRRISSDMLFDKSKSDLPERILDVERLKELPKFL